MAPFRDVLLRTALSSKTGQYWVVVDVELWPLSVLPADASLSVSEGVEWLLGPSWILLLEPA